MPTAVYMCAVCSGTSFVTVCSSAYTCIPLLLLSLYVLTHYMHTTYYCIDTQCIPGKQRALDTAVESGSTSTSKQQRASSSAPVHVFSRAASQLSLAVELAEKLKCVLCKDQKEAVYTWKAFEHAFFRSYVHGARLHAPVFEVT
jgi:hypothetical protein